MKTKTIYETEDGRQFDNITDAEIHEINLIGKKNRIENLGKVIFNNLATIMKHFKLYTTEQYNKNGVEQYRKGWDAAIKLYDGGLKPYTKKEYECPYEEPQLKEIQYKIIKSDKSTTDRIFSQEYENSNKY